MGLTDNQKHLIREIVNKNMLGARKCALACLAEDTTNKNQYFCDKYRRLLEGPETFQIEIPYNLKGILFLEDVKSTFIPGRYFITEREKKLFDRIMRMQRVSSRLKEMRINLSNSAIMYGESGTGKTMFGRYLAYQADLPFCYVRFSQLIDSYLGNTSKNISLVFDFVANTPCVFMLDEIDCISIRRSSEADGSSSEMARVTISLMQEMDRIPSDVIVLAATNRIDRIDEALLRRFSVRHEVISMTVEEKVLLAQRFLQDADVPFTDAEIMDIAANSGNQSSLINHLIYWIAAKLEEEDGQ